MAKPIPSWFIDDLLNRTDIVSIIDARVTLKKAGREFNACCPFHNEKTPSFTVSPAKQFYHCFGCGAHGTALTFLMEYEHLDFIAAVETLAAQQGMQVPRESGAQAVQRRASEDLYAVLSGVNEYYHKQLKQHKNAIDYLNNRGLSETIIADYGIGYAPPGADNLKRFFGADKLAALKKSGMLSANESGKIYDRFRDRIMFPIRDRRGRIIGFGGRVLGADNIPKYLNSPETPIFHKGRALYGLYESCQAVRKLESFYVVEGYMDAVALAQHGIRNVVAALGTATTDAHLKQLLQLAPEIIFCFDGDRAGRDAAWRALQNALPIMRDGVILRFLFLPDGEDPDSMIRQRGKTEFEKLAGKAQMLSTFFFERLSQNLELDTADGRSRLARLAQPYLQKLPGGVFHEIMLKQLAELTGLSVERLSKAAQLEHQSSPQKHRKPAPRQKNTFIRHLITLLLNEPKIAQQIDSVDIFDELDLPGADLLKALLTFLHQQPDARAGTILEHWRDSEYGQHLTKLALIKIDFTEDRLQAEFRDTLANLQRFRRNNPNQLLAKLAAGATLTDEQQAILKQAANPNSDKKNL